MSLGFVLSDGRKIYGFTDNYGLPDSKRILPAKVVCIQSEPIKICIICTGGLDHWSDVYCSRHNFIFPSLKDAVEQVAELLDFNMKNNNQAFGLIFGFENGAPTCYRINRSINSEKTEICSPVGLLYGVIETIGEPSLARKIKPKIYSVLQKSINLDIELILEEKFNEFIDNELGLNNKAVVSKPVRKNIIELSSF